MLGFEEIEGIDVEYQDVAGSIGGERLVKFKKSKTVKPGAKKSASAVKPKSNVKAPKTIKKKPGKVVSGEIIDQLEIEQDDNEEEDDDENDELEGGQNDHKDNDEKSDQHQAVANTESKKSLKLLAKRKERLEKVETRKKARLQKLKDYKKAKKEAAAVARQNVNTFSALAPEEAEVELPEWTNVVSLSDALLRGLKDLAFDRPTDIQRQTIPLITSGRDVVGKASTGSGKTLAFGLAILDRILSSFKDPISQRNSLTFASAPAPTALIFAPTRELVQQICDHVTAVSKYTTANIVSITGGLAIQKQRRVLGYFPDIIVATPGRMHELLTSDTEGLIKWISKVEILVLDEADRLLQEGHFKELDEILDLIGQNNDDDEDLDETTNAVETQNTHRPRQTLVFSATFEKDLTKKLQTKQSSAGSGGKKKQPFVSNTIEGKKDTMEYLLQKLNFRDEAPEFVDVNPEETIKRDVLEGVIMCDHMEKDVYLYYFLLKYPGRTVVFVNNIDAVKRIAKFLQELGLPAQAFHSHMIQKQRLRTIERFKSIDKSILISTDVAARGLDIPHVQHVLHYHLPRSADMYVHRSGRTARGNEKGVAMILCGFNETQQLRKMVITLGKETKDFRVFDVEKKVIAQLSKRVSLATDISQLEIKIAGQGITSSKELQKKEENKRKESELLKQAAEDLGLDDSEIEGLQSDDDDAKDAIQVRSFQAKQKEQDRYELQFLRKNLKSLLLQPIMTSAMASRNYITSGVVNLAQQLVDGTGHETFLGEVKSTALEDVQKSKPKTGK
ncbi:P-loop containing nucleoside triphosphate hydrolase protein [Lipomyces japonicus]|uniref:P-loop containing nucleoside triphosphate hydrolase protein n=1 Tax=Lipomyces japonicus TaxID=56871 RepID=UPI0034CEEAA3